ncbi:MAG TPA: Mur ligase family protein [Clostridiaceae bacterium]|jgi:UDP-N-acetylmuramyl tripeptide synthase|nr:Mur ligase family protein [Clostridiaceae bacterium]
MKEFFIKFRLGLAIIITKLTVFGLRIVGRGGTSLPGKIALRICPDIFNRLSDRFRIIMVTGTNGKTTTSRIIEGMLQKAGLEYISNKSGANLASGIATTLISALSLTGKPIVRTALLETDEAAFRTLAPKLKPEIVIVTNFFRDQLDRFGELYTTLNSVREGIQGSPESRLILNADDSLCASLGQDTSNPVIYFGLGDKVYPEDYLIANADAAFCINCKSRYEYLSSSFAHLGHFKCPNCGYERPTAQIECTQVLEYDNLSSTIEIQMPGGKIAVKLAIPGLYNIYNALAGAAVGHMLDLKEEDLVYVLEGFECGFGRMETLSVNGRELKLILVKNPTGFNQVLKYLMTQKDKCVIGFAINDKLADGTDISWLWDVDFEILSFMQEKVRRFFVSGIRAEDMAVRLKYAGIPSDHIFIMHGETELVYSLLEASNENETIYLLPTYTAMLDIRKSLKKRFNLKEIWE